MNDRENKEDLRDSIPHHQFRRDSDLNIGGKPLADEDKSVLYKILHNQKIIMVKQESLDEKISNKVCDSLKDHVAEHHPELDPPHHAQHERLGNWIKDLSNFWSEFSKVLAWGLAALLAWGVYDLYQGREVIKNVFNH